MTLQDPQIGPGANFAFSPAGRPIPFGAACERALGDGAFSVEARCRRPRLMLAAKERERQAQRDNAVTHDYPRSPKDGILPKLSAIENRLL